MTDAVPLLLATKLHAPRPRRDTLARPRLGHHFDERHYALTLVSAPAGFGKTTLIAEWFAGGPTPAWLSLDARDHEPRLFWTYVLAAIQTVAPALGGDAQELLRVPEVDIHVMLTTLLNDLAAATEDLVIVLDDYHVIESPEVHDSMAFFLDHLPPRVQVVIASRADPPLPLARWRARGDLLEVRAADLQFTAAEAAAYLNDEMQLGVTPADVAVLEARTEGWIAALQLAALSMRDRDRVSDFIAGFAGDDRFVLDYLVGEVLERLDEPDRNFLLETSVLNTLTGPLCDAVTGQPGGRDTLTRLERSNLFLVALDDRRTWYRYHHLFADMLRARLLDERPGEVAELHGRAADWYETDGDRAEAIAHAMAGRHFDRAARLIEMAAPAMHQARQEATLRQWLEALPDHVFLNRPVLTINLIGARMSTGNPADVETLLTRVEDDLSRSTPPSVVFDHENFARLPAQVAVYRAALALLAGDLDQTIEHAELALDLSAPTDHLQRGAAAALIGLAHWTRGDLDPARRRYGDAVASLTAAGHLADVLGCSLGLADIQIAQGRLEAALQTFTAALRIAAPAPGLRGTADMHVGLSEVLLERNELAAAAEHLQASIDLGEPAGLPQHAYRRRVAMARLRQAHGDLDGAFALLQEAEPMYATDFSPAVQPVAARIARVQLARGEIAAAARWADDHNLSSEDELSYVREFEHVTLARVLLRRDDDPQSVERAGALLDRLLDAAEAGRRTGSVIEVLVLLARARERAGDEPGATTALADALARAEPEGYLRVFIDDGPATTTVLRTVEIEGDIGRYARRVLAAIEHADPAPSPSSGLVDDLSARELDVLRLLRSELSGPDIARELFVSLNTLRSHTKSIYTKLGVNNRREAIRRATEVGL